MSAPTRCKFGDDVPCYVLFQDRVEANSVHVNAVPARGAVYTLRHGRRLPAPAGMR